VTQRTLTVVLAGTPYGGERGAHALRLAAAALERGHRVNLFATADGTYLALSGQAARGLPNAGGELERLIARGARVELCGSCLRFRGLGSERLLAGARPSSLKGLGAMLREADAVVSL
jgi:tRNA 2-thiouridine synthesizing protein D